MLGIKHDEIYEGCVDIANQCLIAPSANHRQAVMTIRKSDRKRLLLVGGLTDFYLHLMMNDQGSSAMLAPSTY